MRSLRALRAALITACALFSTGFRLAAKEPTPGAFPLDYRSWTHVKSTLIGPAFQAFEAEGGIHHIYANEKALEGLRSGRFPDGAALVYDLLEVQEARGLTTEGPRRRVDVMVKDSQAYPNSGGWWFGRFLKDDWNNEVLTPEHRLACFECHQQPKARGLVYSRFRK